jgi:hypothetical protein
MSFWNKWFGGKAEPIPAVAPSPAPSSSAEVVEPNEPAVAVRLARVVLFQSDEEIQQRLASPMSALQQYLDQVVQTANRAFQQSPHSARLVTLFVVLKPPSQRRFWIASEPLGFDSTNCHPLLTLLEQLPPPLVQHGPLCLALQVHLGDADGPEENWPTMPREWIEATVGRSVSIPDGLLEVIWPEED